MKATLHPDAEEDLAEAAAFYERDGSAALAARFVAEIKRVISLVLANPGIGSPRTNGRQFFPTKVFPYGIIYRQTPDGIYVLVVKRHRRRRQFGAKRSAPKNDASYLPDAGSMTVDNADVDQAGRDDTGDALGQR